MSIMHDQTLLERGYKLREDTREALLIKFPKSSEDARVSLNMVGWLDPIFALTENNVLVTEGVLPLPHNSLPHIVTEDKARVGLLGPRGELVPGYLMNRELDERGLPELHFGFVGHPAHFEFNVVCMKALADLWVRRAGGAYPFSRIARTIYGWQGLLDMAHGAGPQKRLTLRDHAKIKSDTRALLSLSRKIPDATV